MKKITQIVVLMALTITTTLAQQKGISWVHGLKSTRDFWQPYKNLFEAERSQINKAGSNNDLYMTNLGVQIMADVVPSNNIGIGHSMGGLAVRQASRRSGTPFQGLITCGSPLRGAKIMNSFKDGTVDNAIGAAVTAVLRGPIAQFGGIGSYVIAGTAANALIPLWHNVFGTNFINYNASYGTSTVNDLAEGSPHMNSINNDPNTKPTRAYIWGNENSPVHWRLISSYMRGSDKPWLPNEDLACVNIVNSFSDAYFAFFVLNAGNAVANAIYLNLGATAYFTWVAFEWKAGSDYLRGQSESDWAYMIGADQAYLTNSITTTQFNCSYYHYYNECSQLGVTNPAAAQLCRDACWAPITYTYRYALQGGSDGLVAAPSQRGDYTTWSLGSGDLYEATGVNHIEMRGHTNMTTQFDRIFGRVDQLRVDR